MSKSEFFKLFIISSIVLFMVFTGIYIVSAATVTNPEKKGVPQEPRGISQIAATITNPTGERAPLAPSSIPQINATFTNPIGEGSDPYVVLAGDNYYLIGSNVGIFIKQTPRLQDVADVEPYYVWVPPSGTSYSSQIWAPELHYLDGRWYIYFTASDGSYYNHRMYVLEGGTDADNPLSAPFIFIGNVFPDDNHYAIDGTVLKYDDGLYFIWSGWEADEDNGQNLYIAEMENPWTISGERVLISKPTYDWECSISCVNEGPEAIIHNDTVSIIYSANAGNSDEYCLGQLKLTGSDPMSIDSWTKNRAPVYCKTSKVFGPGHASFVKSPDGTEDWIVYHAAQYSGSGWARDLRAQRFSWNPDNTPWFGSPQNPGIEYSEPAWTVVTSGKYEAENAIRYDCRVLNKSNASGGQVAGYIDHDDSYVQFKVYVDVAGEYMINIRADNGCNSVSSHKVYVNGSLVGDIDYAPMGWGVFSNSAILAALNEGDNTIKLKKGTNYAEVDYIEVSDRFEAENAVLYNCNVVTKKIGASKTKVAGYIDHPNSYVDFYVTVPSSGKYLLTVGNDNGCNAVSSHKIYVNGSLTGSIYYNKNSVWNVFTQASTVVQLNSGSNIIRFMKEDQYAELDYLKLVKPSALYETENDEPYNRRVVSERNAPSGQAVGPIDYASDVQFTVYVESAGIYALDIAADNGCPATSSHHLYINETYIVDIYHLNLGWNKPAKTCLKVELNAGANIIKLTMGYLDAKVDYIAIRK
jgi:GH43 family beta-xylosidase